MEHALLRLDARLEMLSMNIEEGHIFIHASLRNASSCCPQCHVRSHQRHSKYTRTWSDVPDGGTPVTVKLDVSKWFCNHLECPKGVFAERIPWLSPYQRRSLRLDEQIRAIAFSTSALQAENVCRALGILISHDTVLNIIYRTNIFERESPFCRHG